MKINLDMKVFCTCGAELRIVSETQGEITVEPCKNAECAWLGDRQAEEQAATGGGE